MKRTPRARLRSPLSLGVFHELALLLSTSAALWMVLMGGLIAPVAWLCVLAPFVSMFLVMTKRNVPPSSGRILGAASLALGAAQIVAGGMGYVVLGATTGVMGLLVARLLTRRSLDHDLQALVLALVLVVAGSVLNVSLWFALWFVLFAVFATWTLTTRQLLLAAESVEATDEVRGRRDIVTPRFFGATAGVTLVVLVVTVLVFALFPRVGFLRFALSPQASARFPSDVALAGGPRALFRPNDVIARVTQVSESAFMDGLYLRGGVYEVVDGHGFRRAAEPPIAEARALALAPAKTSGRYQVQLSPFAGDLLFTLGKLRAAQPVRGGNANPNIKTQIAGADARTQLRAEKPIGALFAYDVVGDISAPGQAESPRRTPPRPPELFFELAAPLHDALAPLADRYVAGAGDPATIARRLREGLLRDYTYTLDYDTDVGGERALQRFLFESKEGHCEFFATAFAALLRTQGIGSRVIGGYQGGTWDEPRAQVLFYGSNAHAWTEWFHPALGWIVDDATPAPTAPRARLSSWAEFREQVRKWWDDRVVDFSFADQVGGLRSLSALLGEVDGRQLLGAVASAGGGVALFVVAWRYRRRRRSAVVLHPVVAALSALYRHRTGRAFSVSATLREAFAESGVLLEGDAAERSLVDAAITAYEGARFGAAPVADNLITGLERYVRGAVRGRGSRG